MAERKGRTGIAYVTERQDVVIIGAGAAGMMCAIEAGRRGRRVLVLDHAQVVQEGVPEALAVRAGRYADLFSHAVA